MRKNLLLMVLLLIGLFYASAYAGQATIDLTLQDQGDKEGVSVSLSLRGMKKYSDFAHLKTFLQNRPKIVKNAYPCCFEWQRADFDLIMIGSVEILAAELEKSGRYSVESLKKNKNVVEISLQVKEEVQ